MKVEIRVYIPRISILELEGGIAITWRTIILSNESKISLRMNHLIVSGETIATIPLDELGVLLIENPNITLTGHVVNTLAAKKVTTIICDKKHYPSTVLHSVFGHHRQSKRIKEQFSWPEERKDRLWRELIKHKIINQQKLLDYFDLTGADEMSHLINEVQLADQTNREGVAAKHYFLTLFGSEFNRSDEDVQNWALNYGYSIIHSLFSRQIVGKGLLTEIGIHHSNEYNAHNLASDFMEIFRPIVDFIVYQYIRGERFEKEERRKMIKIMEYKIWIRDGRYYLNQCVQIYLDYMVEYLKTGDEKYLIFPELDYAKYY